MAGFFSKKQYSIARSLKHWAFWIFLIFTVLQSGVFLYLWNHSVIQNKQRSEWSVATSLAKNIQDSLYPKYDYESLRRKIDSFLDENPNRDVHFITESGIVVGSFSRAADQRLHDQVDIEPIRQFLSLHGRALAPLFGADPYSTARDALISVAPLRLLDGAGYLYLNLENSRARRVRLSYLDSGVIIALGASYGCALIAALLLAYWRFAAVGKRITTLMAGVSRYRDGDHSARVTEQGNDELSELGRTFNTLADSLGQLIKKLESRDVLRRELVENIWHDIRGPVGALRGLSEILAAKQDKASPEVVSEVVSGISSNAEHLARFLIELREVSDLDLGEKVPELLQCNIVDVADELVAALAVAAAGLTVELRVDTADDEVLVLADPAMISRLLRNLVENALKFSEKGGIVRIQIKRLAAGVEIAVEDSGKGISEAELPHVFDRQFQSSATSSIDRTSRGLGLAIVKKIAEAHQTTVAVRSEPGKGSRFSFILAAPH